MLLYLDDDTIEGVLVKLLRKAGHDVAIPGDVGLSGADDTLHLIHAIRCGRPFVTYNYEDFEQLHELVRTAGGQHPGILVIRKDNDKRDLRAPGIVKALSKFLATGNPIASQYVILNQYR
jgi:hypothetical protein